MKWLNNILESGVNAELPEHERRHISLTNYISLILVGSIIIAFFSNLFLRSFWEPKYLALLLLLVLFSTPILLNRLNRIDFSRVFLIYVPVLFLWFGIYRRSEVIETNIVTYYDGFRIFLLAMSPIPYLIYNKNRLLFLVITILPTLVSILFYNLLFSHFIKGNEVLANARNIEFGWESFRWIIGYVIVSASCLSFRKIIDSADEEKEELIKTLEAQAEEIKAQNESLTKLSVVVNQSTNAIAIFDKHGNFEWVNNGFNELYDQTIEELYGNEGFNLFETIPNSYLAEDNSKDKDLEVKLILSEINSCIRSKKPVHYEYQTITKSGNQIIVQTTLSPILDDDGEIKNLIAIDTDIYKLKQAEKKIKKQKDEIIEQAEELKKRNNEVESQSLHLKQLYEKIKSISENQEKIIEDRTREIKEQNEKILNYAFMNAHKLRGPVARILGLIYLCKNEKSGVDLLEMFHLIEGEVAELDKIIFKINSILEK